MLALSGTLPATASGRAATSQPTFHVAWLAPGLVGNSSPPISLMPVLYTIAALKKEVLERFADVSMTTAPNGLDGKCKPLLKVRGKLGQRDPRR